MRKIIFVLALVLMIYLLYAAVLWPLFKSAMAVTEQSVVYAPGQHH